MWRGKECSGFIISSTEIAALHRQHRRPRPPEESPGHRQQAPESGATPFSILTYPLAMLERSPVVPLIMAQDISTPKLR